MEQFPKFVVERIARTQRGEDTHPDANMLSAFNEGQLAVVERDGVIAHLAGCAECRDIVALATAQASEIRKRSFVYWPWLGVAAAACLLVTVTMWHPPVVSTPTLVRQLPANSFPGADEQPKKNLTVVTPKNKQRTPVQRPPSTRTPARIEPPQQVDSVSPVGIVGGAENLVPPAPPVETAPQNEKYAQSISAPTVPALPVRSAQQVAAPPPAPKSLQGARSFRLFASKAGIATPTLAELNQSLWNIGAAPGELRKSDDGGRTWSQVSVDNKTTLLAINVAEREIWAGGVDGALFYSQNNGITWDEVVVSYGTGRLRDAITKIERTGAREIRVSTRAGTWISVDGGMNWRKE